jgi:superoxide dismutase, Cu-Zn family
MRNIIALAMLPLCAACAAGNMGGASTAQVYAADLMQMGAKVGSVTLTEAGGGAALSLTVSGLPTGTYGAHIHETGKCDGPGYKSAGGHWNPSAKQHGLQNPAGTHGGDLENIMAVAGQATRVERQLAAFKLSGTGGLMDTDGAAFIIHAKADDNKTDPSGNSGDRMICGVFDAG